MASLSEPSAAAPAVSQVVCVHNRNRDGYEVPLALAEAGLLSGFVTDFYADPRLHRLLPRFLARRYRQGLPATLTHLALGSFAVQYLAELLKVPMQRVFGLTDRLLGSRAVRLARRQGAGLLAYSSYLDGDPRLGPGAAVIDFEYHPHPALTMEILEADFARYPQVAWSMALERKAAGNKRVNDAWRHADSVICASAMTRASLERAGCPPERITVIPYGSDGNAPDAVRRPDGPCRFLFVGQGLQRKGLHHLALAWQEAAPTGSELTIVSYRTDPGIVPLLDQRGITVLGRQSREELNALFRSADVFIMPSLVEGFGLVYLEALEAGCHVVGTRETGLPDLNLTPQAATIVPAGEILALAETITGLERRKAAGDLDPAAIQAEARRWTWKEFREAIAAHVRQVLDRVAVSGTN
ncbi:MAG: hypothetical protein RL702_2370 [Pseudomonadota bacterium]